MPWTADGTVKVKDLRGGGSIFDAALALAVTKVATMDKTTRKRLPKTRLRSMLQEVKVSYEIMISYTQTPCTIKS
jgi:hypothetical protein